MNRSQPGQLGILAALPFEFEQVTPPTDIADLVNTFFVIRTETGQIEEMMPAYSAQLLVFETGSIVLRPQDAPEYRTETVCCSTPLLQAIPVTFSGPVRLFGASLTALGWQALSYLPADEINNRILSGKDVLGLEAADELATLAAQFRTAEADPADLFGAIGDILQARRGTIKRGHAQLVAHIMQWLASDLDPPLSDLYRDIGASERTVQRLSRRFFGVPPLLLAKRFRAIRAAMLLANPDLPQSMRDAVIDAYFDQAHLIRDIRRYTGRTPKRLVAGELIEDTLDPGAHGEAARLLRQRHE